MIRREAIAVAGVLSVSLLLLTSFVTGAPVSDGAQLINKEILFPPEGSLKENDVDVEELHSLTMNTKSTGTVPISHFDGSSHRMNTLTAANDEKRSSNSKSEFIISDFTSSSDTPRDMAEYIFWTGDENSVSTAIKDFVEQGLMTVQDGKDFLDEVRHDLHQIQLRYGTSVEKPNFERASNRAEYFSNKDESNEDSRQLAELAGTSKVEADKPHEGEIVVTSYRTSNRSQDQPLRHHEHESNLLENEIKLQEPTTINNKEEIVNEAHLVNLLNNEYSLEEIIYQLARILFSQSLKNAGHPEAEEALKKFADFLEKESKEGKMSPQVQKKVLDVLLMSLFDAIGEQGQQLTSLPSGHSTKSSTDEVATQH